MECLAPFNHDGETIESWINNLNYGQDYRGKNKTHGLTGDNYLSSDSRMRALKFISSDKPYANLKAHLQFQLGERQSRQDAFHKPTTPVKGNLSCRELAHQATHLSQVAL